MYSKLTRCDYYIKLIQCIPICHICTGNANASQSSGRQSNDTQQRTILPGQTTSSLQSPLASHNQRSSKQCVQVKGHGRGLGREVGGQRTPGLPNNTTKDQYGLVYANQDQFSNAGTPDASHQYTPVYNNTSNASRPPMSFLAKQRQASLKGSLKGTQPVSQPNVFPKGKEPFGQPKGKEPFGQMLRPEERSKLGFGRVTAQPGRSKQGQDKTVFNRPGMMNR